MYLKSRYTNYYLIGTYTEDRTRHERLRENSATLTPILRQLTSLSSKVRFRKMERCGSASGKIGDLKELIAFQEMAKQLQEISKNVCAGPENADLDNLLRDYNNFAESVFQTPSEFEYLIRKMNGLINFWRLRRKAIWKPIRKTGLPFTVMEG